MTRPARQIWLLFWAIAACILWAATFASAGAQPPPAALKPVGIFVLASGQGNAKVQPRQLQDRNVAGISLRRQWSHCQPKEDRLDWSYFDRELPAIARAGKVAMLHVDADYDGTPQWVLDECRRNGETYSYIEDNPHHPDFGERFELCVPWSPLFKQHWLSFIDSFGRKYDDNPTVVAVHIGGPSRSGSECYWPEEVKRVRGYSKDAVLETWAAVFDIYGMSFPDTYVVLNLGNPVPGEKLAARVVQEFRGSKIRYPALQHNSLSAKTSLGYDIHKLVHDVGQQGFVTGFQQVSGSNKPRYGGSFGRSLVTAKAAKADYHEIYEFDRTKLSAPWKAQ